MFKSIVAVAFIFSTGTAFGQVPNGVAIEGSVDCGSWVKARKEKKAQYFEHFAIGFVNGLALGRFVEIWQAYGVKVTREQVLLWLDKYCAENPLEGVTAGVVQLANERTKGEFGRVVRKK